MDSIWATHLVFHFMCKEKAKIRIYMASWAVTSGLSAFRSLEGKEWKIRDRVWRRGMWRDIWERWAEYETVMPHAHVSWSSFPVEEVLSGQADPVTARSCCWPSQCRHRGGRDAGCEQALRHGLPRIKADLAVNDINRQTLSSDTLNPSRRLVAS